MAASMGEAVRRMVTATAPPGVTVSTGATNTLDAPLRAAVTPMAGSRQPSRASVWAAEQAPDPADVVTPSTTRPRRVESDDASVAAAEIWNRGRLDDAPVSRKPMEPGLDSVESPAREIVRSRLDPVLFTPATTDHSSAGPTVVRSQGA